MNNLLFLVPVITAFICWLVMWLASRALVNRIIPARQGQLATQIASTAANAFPIEMLSNKISDPSNVKKVMPMVEQHIDQFLRHKLKEKMPVVGMFIGDKTINSLKEVFLKEIEELFPQVLAEFAGNLRSQIDIEKIIADKITAVSPGQIKTALSPLLRYFQTMGIIAGVISGAVSLLFEMLVHH